MLPVVRAVANTPYIVRIIHCFLFLSSLYIPYIYFVHVRSASHRGPLIALFLFTAQCNLFAAAVYTSACTTVLLSIGYGNNTRSRQFDINNLSRLIHLTDRFNYHTIAPSFACSIDCRHIRCIQSVHITSNLRIIRRRSICRSFP